MKTIGLLGGMSWESTVPYYRQINEAVKAHLGGLHSAVEDSIEMDSLGLTLGETYPMDIFHAERHTNESNFRIETTIQCFVTPPPA